MVKTTKCKGSQNTQKLKIGQNAKILKQPKRKNVKTPKKPKSENGQKANM